MKDIRIDMSAAGASVVEVGHVIATLTKDEAAEVYAVIEAAKKRQSTEELRKERERLKARLAEIDLKLFVKPADGTMKATRIADGKWWLPPAPPLRPAYAPNPGNASGVPSIPVPPDVDPIP